MQPPYASVRWTLLALVLCAGCPQPLPPATDPPPRTKQLGSTPETLTLRVTEGEIDNAFYRSGPISAHLLVRSGKRPRIIVAFPAGNMGLALWFDPLDRPAACTIEKPVRGVERPAGLRGIDAVIRCDAPRLRLKRALLGSVWSIRGWAPEGVRVPPLDHEVRPGPPLSLQRVTADKKHRIALELDGDDGTAVRVDRRSGFVIEGSSALRFRLVALSDQPPLTPIAVSELFNGAEAGSPEERRALALLSYREKLLAGSWRFLTYFGRDTLLSVNLLMPVLRPVVIEAALRSVIERLSPIGQVAHEEHIGEMASFRNLQRSPRPADLQAPHYDYKMIDDDFMLAPVLATYLLDTQSGRDRAKAFLARETATREPFIDAIRRNLTHLMSRAAPFASSGQVKDLIALNEGHAVGEWRDSEAGLGGGRYPYNVNCALVPAALRAAARLYRSPLLGPDLASAVRAKKMAAAWKQAERTFQLRMSRDEAVKRVQGYAKEIGIDPREALAALDGDLSLLALALDPAGKPIEVMHSDDSFTLMFSDPPAAFLDQAARRILRPFPAGLRTPVGIVVANAAFAKDRAIREMFTRSHYHGAVVWSWQQAMLAAGLARQLRRDDLPPRTRSLLDRAETALWKVIEATRTQRTGELWSWAPTKKGGFRLIPFGAEQGHHDESNAIQLWSTVYLAVQPPKK